jgi:integrase
MGVSDPKKRGYPGLTDAKVKSAKAKASDYRLADTGGLRLHVTKTGHRSWRLRVRIAGREQLIVLGSYPDMSLKQARAARDDAKRILRDGGDPRVRRRAFTAADPGDSFEVHARAWHANQKGRWSEVHSTDVITSMERDLFPELGAMAVGAVDQLTFLAVLRKVEGRGAIETAHRLRQRADKVFRFARSVGSPNTNPAADVSDALKPKPANRRWPALLVLDEVRALVRDIDAAGASPITRLASRFLAVTAQRPGMVRRMQWGEIVGIDWDSADSDTSGATWRVPAARMKQELALRQDAAFDHAVPLPPQAVEALRAVRALTGAAPYVFCSGWDATDPMSENALSYLYAREGYRGRHVPHGWRASFSTIMNSVVERSSARADRMHLDRLVIDLMLAHTPAGMSPTELLYNRNAYPERRREIGVMWADMLMAGVGAAADLLSTPRRKRPA